MTEKVLIPGTQWFTPVSMPKDGTAFLFSTFGPQVDIGWWDVKDECLRDYYHKQKIRFVGGWQPLPEGVSLPNVDDYLDLMPD